MGRSETMLRALATRAPVRQFQTSAVRRAGEFKIPGEAATTEHAIEATADWKKYTFWGIGAVGAMGVLQFFIHMSHGHHEDLTLYPFRRIRNKPFPWGDGQHSLFGCSIDDAEQATNE